MKKREVLLFFLLFAAFTGLFFYKTIIHGLVPYPGDLLIAEYNPWKSYSYLGYNPASYPNKAQYFDVLRQLYPWKTFSLNQLKSKSIPLWNPHNFSGSPLLANFQSAVFYPLNIVYFITPQIIAWSILVFLQPLLSLLFTFLFARKIGLSKTSSAFASISFAFSSFSTVWLEYNTVGHVILWLSLILLSVEEMKEKISVHWIMIFIFSIISALLAGHIQIFVYLYVFVFAYYFFRIRKLSLLFIVLFLLPLGIGAFQLIPGFELIKESARSPHPYDFFTHKILIQVWQLIMIFVPDFFGNPATRNYWIKDTYVGDVMSVGLVPLFFILITFFGKINFYIRFFWLSILGVLIFITNNPIAQLLYHLNIPFISSSGSNLAVFILLFSLSILCGFGVDFWRKEGLIFKKYVQIALPFVGMFCGLWIALLMLPKQYLAVSMHNLIYSTFLFAFSFVLLLISVLNTKMKYIILLVLFLIHGFDLWRSFEKFNPFVPKELVYPSSAIFDFLSKNAGINRIVGFGAANIEANFATQFSLYSPDGYDPLYPKRYGEFIKSSEDGKIATQFTTQTRSDAVLSFEKVRVLDVLGVKYVLDRNENASTQKTFPKERYSLIYQKDGWKIFENKKALPRAFLVSNYKIAKTPEDFERTFFSKGFDPSKAIILEEILTDQNINNRTIEQSNNDNFGVANILEYKQNKIVINTNANISSLLFLSDTYYPGWKAYVDGKETKIYRADYTFRSIQVPKGEHDVIFAYDPESFKLGFSISVTSLVLLVIILARFTHRR